MKQLFLIAALLASSSSWGACISGNCINGIGTFTWANGNKYVGEWKDDKQHGQGTYNFANGDKYVGEFKDNKKHGQGTYTHANGNKYVGEWKDGNRHGQGTATYASGYASGDKYVGEWKDGNRHGQGTYTYASGNKYVGETKDGIKDGFGTATFANGNKYVGEWKDNKYHGQGTFTFANGNKYVGEWKDNDRHGQGTYTSENGTKQTGFYLNGSFVPYLCQERGLTRGTDAFGQCVNKLIDEVNRTLVQAEYQDELYDALKDKLTHIACKASGQNSITVGTYTDPSQVKETDYFSFDDFGFLWARLEKLGYLRVLIQVPNLEESGKFKPYDDNNMFNVHVFNDDSITIHFEANKGLLGRMSKGGVDYKKKSMKFFIDRNSGNYTTTTDGSMYVPFGESTELGNVTEKLSGSCELYDPDKKKF